MDYSQKKAKQKYLYDKPDVLTDKQTIRNRKKDISKYNRVIEKEIIEEEYNDYLNIEEYNDSCYDDFEEYGGFDEYMLRKEIDLDNLPEGVTFEDHGCDGINHEKEYSEEYDAMYCRNCDTWLEIKCNDDDCEFCSKRPERPSEA